MTTVTLFFALATLGVKTGWQPVDDGALEYIIQIEPPLLEALKSGHSITSEIPAALQGVRRYRIVVGESQLPQVGLAPQAPPAATEATSNAGPPQPRETSPSENRYPRQSDRPHVPDRRPLLPQPPTETVPSGSSPLPAADPATSGLSAEHRPSGQPGEVTKAPGVQGAPEPEPTTPDPDNRYASPSPRPFEADPESAKLVAGAVTVEVVPANAGPAAEPAPTEPVDSSPSDRATDDSEGSSADSRRPWVPLTLTLLGLFASMGGNVYLGWIAWDSRRHYRQLVRQSGPSTVSSLD